MPRLHYLLLAVIGTMSLAVLSISIVTSRSSKTDASQQENEVFDMIDHGGSLTAPARRAALMDRVVVFPRESMLLTGRLLTHDPASGLSEIVRSETLLREQLIKALAVCDAVKDADLAMSA